MATKLAQGVYQLTQAEGLTLQLSAVGTAFTVSATVDTTVLQFPQSGAVTKITPAMLGVGVHTANLHTFFSLGATAQASYQLLVTDDKGSQLDHLKVHIVAGQALPYQALTQLAIIVPQGAAK